MRKLSFRDVKRMVEKKFMFTRKKLSSNFIIRKSLSLVILVPFLGT